MKATLLALALLGAAAFVAVAAVGPVAAIVHPTAAVACGPAVEASDGQAGGAAAFGVVSNNPSPGPPFTAQGHDHAAVCDGG